VQKHTTSTCKRVDKTKSYINRSNVHQRFRGRWSWRTTFCGGIDNAEGCKGEKCYCEGRTFIRKSAIESIASHKGAQNGISTTKGDGDAVAWSQSGSEEKMHNLVQSYTYGKKN
jgi:hypothetical protein